MGLSEADTRAKLIDPAIHASGWTEDLICREETAGAIEIVGDKPRKRSHGRVDYTLRIRVAAESQPVAVALIEAKASDLPPDHGLEQGKCYASCKRLNVPFVFASNGHLYVEFDSFSGLTSAPRPITEFPSPTEIRCRYEQGMGFNLSDPAAMPLLSRYKNGEQSRRYYQDAAIRAVLEKIAKCEKTGVPKRALLSLATGSGKTRIAVFLLQKIADAKQLRRALFVCDREELRSQGVVAFQSIFGDNATEVHRDSDGRNHARNATIHVSTYQTLNVDNDEGTANFLIEHYPENYFSHIIIDECHRSAWGKWSQVLTRNPNAVQIGLTATPRQLEYTECNPEAQIDSEITANNITYFGEPVYEYDISQGIEDGYLAACEIIRCDIFLESKPAAEQITGLERSDLNGKELKDAITGQPVTAEAVRDHYDAPSFEAQLLLPERVAAMSRDLFDHLLATGGPEQKTIIFCARDVHADRVASQLNNLYAEWCSENGIRSKIPYAFKCTASVGGALYLADLRAASSSHFIATTVDLLTTGVDVPCVRNIVFFKYVRSPISFYQMLGRGTRIDTPSGKLMFRVYDYTDATRLFGKEFITRIRGPRGEPGPEPPPPEPTVVVEGIDVRVSDAGRFVVTEVDGKAMPITVEEYKERLSAKLVEEAPTLEQFRSRWITPIQRRELLGHLPDAGRSPLVVQTLEDMGDYDLFDVLVELGYGMSPRTRTERADAFTYKNRPWLDGLPESARSTLRALAAQFALSGTDALENREVFRVPSVAQAGGLTALKLLGQPAEVLQETKERMFSA